MKAYGLVGTNAPQTNNVLSGGDTIKGYQKVKLRNVIKQGGDLGFEVLRGNSKDNFEEILMQS